ncbi:MAG: C4-type zinc ribbon domain-containing protein [Candidatus Omnitrophica bacterium]|nr:C4-type zinc ribbon domain-containing protein [Candidatus Omnitrophota bacterium]
MLKDEIEKLVRLQEIDSEIFICETVIENFPALKSQMEKSIETATQDISFIKKEQKKIHVEKKEKELELQSIEDEIKKLQKRLDEVKTNKEYTSLLSEIDNQKKKKGEIEDIILLLMEKEDEINKKLVDFSRKSEEIKKEIEVKIIEETKKVEEMQKRLEEKKSEREKIVVEIRKDVYDIYEKIRAGKKDGVAICKLEGQSCTGCSMFVPVYVAEKVKAKKEIVHCENCSRILY